jgi:flagellar hook-basal body complex protein FliE
VNLRIDTGLSTSDARTIDRLDRTIDTPSTSKAQPFVSELGKAIGEIDKLQNVADVQADAVARGAGNIHEMALALEKADVAMRLAMRVRNKLVDTYNEIMRMGI